MGCWTLLHIVLFVFVFYVWYAFLFNVCIYPDILHLFWLAFPPSSLLNVDFIIRSLFLSHLEIRREVYLKLTFLFGSVTSQSPRNPPRNVPNAGFLIWSLLCSHLEIHWEVYLKSIFLFGSAASQSPRNPPRSLPNVDFLVRSLFLRHLEIFWEIYLMLILYSDP